MSNASSISPEPGAGKLKKKMKRSRKRPKMKKRKGNNIGRPPCRRKSTFLKILPALKEIEDSLTLSPMKVIPEVKEKKKLLEIIKEERRPSIPVNEMNRLALMFS